MTNPSRQATSLRPGQFRHLIRVAGVTGRMPERDQMLLWLTHTTGIRVTELALLRIDDVLYPSGAIRDEVYLRAEITKGCRPRNIHLTHPKCIAAINAWLEVRRYRGWGLSGDSAYRGFLPHTKLVLTHKGRSFELAVKRRELDAGLKEYRACDALQQTMSRLYRQAGIQAGIEPQRPTHAGCKGAGCHRRCRDGAGRTGPPGAGSHQAILDCRSGDNSAGV
ncbi:hypothetical protein GCM10007159_40630 [Modicisalibacter luteus]|nr:site-specific integrase [Halomonas lutea]GHB14138.1 hypothetical protein GCM10007159_40630 [Halomonas lutea]